MVSSRLQSVIFVILYSDLQGKHCWKETLIGTYNGHCGWELEPNFEHLVLVVEDTKQPCPSESGVLAMFSRGLNHHLQSAAECGAFV